MIIKKLILHPFAGTPYREVSLQPGLNVIEGPNDIGKSTLFRAIECILFIPSRLRANTIEGRELKRLIPIGGDHARISIEFEKQGALYQLEKTWGPSPISQLTFPDGKILNTPEKIEETLRELAPVPSGTFRSVLLTSHNALQRTVDELNKNAEALHCLGDALRLSLNQSNGISIDRFKSSLQQKLEEIFLNWEITSQSPKKGRGIENPWERQGSVLRAYYTKELLRQKLTQTRNLETDLGDQSKTLSKKLELQSELRNFIQDHEKTVQSISERQNLQLKLDQATQETNQLTQDFTTWNQAESHRKLLEPEITRLESLIQSLNQELREARTEVGRKAFLARFEKIETARKTFEELRHTHSLIPKLTQSNITQLQNCTSSIEKLKASLLAAKLQVDLTSKSTLELAVQRDFESEKKEITSPTTPLVIRAGGKIRISTELFHLTVTSGDGKMEQLEAQLQKESESLNRFLTQFQLNSIEEAYARYEKWKQSKRLVESAEIAFQALLSGEDYATLVQQFQTTQNSRPCRDPDLIEKDHTATHQLLTAKKSDLTASIRTLQEIQRRNPVRESFELAQRMVQKGVEQQTLRTQISQLPPLPAEIKELQTILDRFKQCQQLLPTLADEIRELTRILTEIKTRMPEQSAQDFDREYRQAYENYERALKQGSALLRVLAITQDLEKNNSDHYEDFRSHVEQSLSQMSHQKYGRFTMKGSLPQEFIRNGDGAKIPYSWLSAGTQDALALSLRLAMAKFFLKNRSGFILMDDPLIAMDPQKQQAAVSLLREFSKEAQTVLFTCHPSHADLLGGNHIRF